MTFGEKLTNLRRAQNYTQEQFANLLGVSRQAVSRWESGTAYPETDKLIKIAEMFDCSVDYLLKESVGEPTTTEKKEAPRNKLKVITVTVLSVLVVELIIGALVAAFIPRRATITIRSRYPGLSEDEAYEITYKEVASSATHPTGYEFPTVYGDWDLKHRDYDYSTFVVIDVKHLDKASIGSAVFVDTEFDRLYLRDNSTGLWRIFVAVSCTDNTPIYAKLEVDKRNGEFYKYFVD